jgi:hypothetical protein
MLGQAQAKLEGLRPLNIVVSADRHHKAEEWLPNMEARISNPKLYPVLKNNTKSEPGKKCRIYSSFCVSYFAWMLRMFLVKF